MDQTILELNQKIDLLSTQVQFLVEQAHAAERQREERAELFRDLTPIVNDAYRLTVAQLEEVEQYVDLNDLLRLFKRLLRNGRNIEKMLDQLESALDLIETIGPLSDEAFCKVVETLEQLEHKGYFAFARGGMHIADNVVGAFGEAELRQLGDNIVPLLQIAQEMTRPEVISFVRNTVDSIDRDKALPVETSMIALWRQMQNPDVRRGLAISLRALGAVGAQIPGPAGKGGNGR